MANSYLKTLEIGNYSFVIIYYFAHSIDTASTQLSDGVFFEVTCSSFPGESFHVFYPMDVFMSSSLSFRTIASIALAEFYCLVEKHDSSR